jgi:hypothetical protein
MYLLLAIAAAAVGVFTGPLDFADTPLSQLTVKTLLNHALPIVGYGCAVVFLIQSLRYDRIWPWRWTIRYVGNLLVRCAALSTLLIGAYFLFDKSYLSGWRFLSLIVFGVIFLFYVLFSPDFEVFKEPDKPEPSAVASKSSGSPASERSSAANVDPPAQD